MNLEQWVIDLLESIRKAGYNGENFDLHLENEAAKKLHAFTTQRNGLKYIKGVENDN